MHISNVVCMTEIQHKGDLTMGRRLLQGVFSYRTRIPVEVLSVLDYDDKSTKDFWYEIVRAGLKGRLDYSRDFNQRGYCSRVKDNQSKLERDYYKKCPHLDYSEKSENDKPSPYTVKIGSIQAMETAFEVIEDDEAVKQAFECMIKTQEVLLVEEGIDLKLLLQNALQNIPSAVLKLKSLCSEDYYVPNVPMSLVEQIQTILSSESAVSLIENL